MYQREVPTLIAMFRYIRVVPESMLSHASNDRWLATAPDFTAMQGHPEASEKESCSPGPLPTI